VRKAGLRGDSAQVLGAVSVGRVHNAIGQPDRVQAARRAKASPKASQASRKTEREEAKADPRSVRAGNQFSVRSELKEFRHSALTRIPRTTIRLLAHWDSPPPKTPVKILCRPSGAREFDVPVHPGLASGAMILAAPDGAQELDAR
jgi:hypothetical protein